MSNLWSYINPLSASLIGAYALYLFKGTFTTLLDFLAWKGLASITTYSKEGAFKSLSEWISDHHHLKGARHTSLRNIGDEDDVQIAPGEGWHFFTHKSVPYLLHWSVSNLQNNSGFSRHEVIQIYTLSIFKKALRKLTSEAIVNGEASSSKVSTYLYMDYWWRFSRRTSRSLDTIYLAGETDIKSLTQDIDTFLSQKHFYEVNGIPYHRGYFFYGVPGSGKSSVAAALAGKYGRPLYVLNLGSIKDDTSLIEAALRCPANSILLIEDIDAALVSHSRSPLPETDDKAEKKEGISLSCLLNVLDGSMAKEGRILIITANYPEKLDPALTRDGRVDYRLEFKDLPKSVAEAMIERSGLDHGAMAQLKGQLQTLNNPSHIQGLILKALPKV